MEPAIEVANFQFEGKAFLEFLSRSFHRDITRYMSD